MTESNLTVRQLITKLGMIGWSVDLYIEPKHKYWECKIWKKLDVEKSVTAAGTSRLSALWATIIELINTYA
jgi:hypothetical protein